MRGHVGSRPQTVAEGLAGEAPRRELLEAGRREITGRGALGREALGRSDR